MSFNQHLSIRLIVSQNNFLREILNGLCFNMIGVILFDNDNYRKSTSESVLDYHNIVTKQLMPSIKVKT